MEALAKEYGLTHDAQIEKTVFGDDSDGEKSSTHHIEKFDV
jgi:hypothetical protein